MLTLRAVGTAAFAAFGIGRHRTLLAKCDELATRAGTPQLRAYHLFGTGFVNFVHGNWKESREQLTRAGLIFSDECAGASWETATTHIFGLWDDFYAGNLAELRLRTSALGQSARERGDLYEATVIDGQIQPLCDLVSTSLNGDDQARRFAEAVDSV